MKTSVRILLFLTFALTAKAQSVSKSDSLEILQTSLDIFQAIALSDQETLKTLMTDPFFCPLCFEGPDLREKPFMISRESFLEEHLEGFRNGEIFKNANLYRTLSLAPNHFDRLQITAYWAFMIPSDSPLQSEGAQLGLEFRKIENEYRWTGISTIP